MKRTAFARKPPTPRPPRERQPIVLVPREADAPRAVMAVAQARPINPTPPRIEGRRDQRIRDSARGEECTVRIPGICTGNAEHTIWSHAPLAAAGKGRGLKAIDLAGAYCCTACDSAIDGQRPLPAGYDRAQALLDWFFGHLRSLVRLKQKGLA